MGPGCLVAKPSPTPGNNLGLWRTRILCPSILQVTFSPRETLKERPGGVSRAPKFPRPLKGVCSQGMAELASLGQASRSLLCRTHNPEKAGGLPGPGGYRTRLPATSRSHNLRTFHRLVLGNRKEHLALEREGSLGSTSVMRRPSSCLQGSKPCKECGACRPFGNCSRHTLHGWHARCASRLPKRQRGIPPPATEH